MWDEQGQRVHRRARRPVVLRGRPRPRRDRRRRRRSDAAPGRLRHVRAAGQPARARPGRARLGALAACRRRRLLHERRLGGGRHGREARPPLLARARAAREAGDRAPPPRLPRHERLRHEPGRHPLEPRGLRHADRRRRLGVARRSGRARRAARGARRPGGGLHRRAGDRRRRHPAPARGLLGGRAGAVPAPRRAPDRRRGDHRLRAARPLVRQRAARDRARSDHLRQGDHLRLPAARRGDRERARAGAVLVASRAPSSGTASRTRATPPPARRASRTST